LIELIESGFIGKLFFHMLKWMLNFLPLLLFGLSYEYRIDSDGHLSEIFTPDKRCQYTYLYSPEGHLTHATDLVGNASCSRSYDEAGRLIQELFCGAFLITYSYDTLGRRTRMGLPDGSAITYSYTTQNHLEAIIRLGADGSERYRHIFLSHGMHGEPILEQMIGAAGLIQRLYDEKGRLYGLFSPIGEEIVMDRDRRGNILCMQRGCFTYDEKSALVQEPGHTYTYDERGNRTSKDGTPYVVENDRLPFIYEYDEKGNVIAKEDLFLSYDAFGRLVEVLSTQGKRSLYEYDGFHRRLSETSFSWTGTSWKMESKRYFLYDNQYEIGTIDQSGNLLELRILGLRNFGDTSSSIAIEKAGVALAPIHDLFGNVKALVSPENGAVVEIYSYTAFGEEKTPENPHSPWRYSSKRTDPTTHFVFFGRRYYDPSVGRFLTPDPLGDADGHNLYTFVHNNPLSCTDLFGLESLVSQIASWIGTAIQQYCYHATPFPGIRNLGIYIGELLGAPSISVDDEKSSIGSVGSLFPGKNQVGVWLNGINTNFQDTVDLAQYVSECCGGLKIYYAYCSTHGFMADVWDLIADKLHFRTAATEIALETLRTAIQAVGGPGGGGKISVFAHSHGARIFEKAALRLSKEETQLLEVYTFGPAAIFPLGNFGSVKHTLSDKDYFSFCADPIRFIQHYIWNPNILNFPKGSDGTVFENHAICGPTYQQEILQIGSLIKN